MERPTFCNKYWAWLNALKMCAWNLYWWTSIATFSPRAHETLLHHAEVLHVSLQPFPVMLYGTGSDSCTQPLLTSLCPPPQLTAVWHDTLRLSVSWQTLTKGRKGSDDLDSTSVSFRLCMAGLPQFPCSSFPFRKSKSGIKSKSSFLLFFKKLC